MPYKSKTQKANQLNIENTWKRAREKSVIDKNNNLEMFNNDEEWNDVALVRESSFLIDTSTQTDFEKFDKNIQTENLMCSKKTQTMEMVKNELKKFSNYNVMSKKKKC